MIFIKNVVFLQTINNDRKTHNKYNIMTAITVQSVDTAHINHILAYAKKENLKAEIFEPEFDETYISRDKLYAKIDYGIEEYKQGKAKKLDVNEINSFLGL